VDTSFFPSKTRYLRSSSRSHAGTRRARVIVRNTVRDNGTRAHIDHRFWTLTQNAVDGMVFQLVPSAAAQQSADGADGRRRVLVANAVLLG